jgi:hypothetical protein
MCASDVRNWYKEGEFRGQQTAAACAHTPPAAQ